MSYDIPRSRTFSWTNLNWSAGNITRMLKCPPGKKLVIDQIIAQATTSFVGSTTPGSIQIGDGTTQNKFATLNMGTAGAGTAAGSVVVANDYPSGLTQLNPAGFVVSATGADMTVTFVAPTGTPAGAADVHISFLVV